MIHILVTSSHDDEVYAAGKMLLENEEMKRINFRLCLIDKLEQLNNTCRLISIIEYTDLDSPLNRKDIIGKSHHQIISDANYYRDIAERARRLM